MTTYEISIDETRAAMKAEYAAALAALERAGGAMKHPYMKHPYYPTHHLGCNPIHKVHNWAYVRKLIRAARRGEEINPILIDGEIGNCNLLAGTHRAAANDIMVMLGGEPLIPVVSLDDIDASDDLIEAVEYGDFDAIDELWDR